jgi:hypothetical protein
MDTLTRTKRASPRQQGCLIKHILGWMAHASNLAKGSSPHIRHDRSLCPFCNEPETQYHINDSCTHPPVVEMQQTLKRQIMNFFQSYRHQSLPQHQRWMILLIDYVQDTLGLTPSQEGTSGMGGGLVNYCWTSCRIGRMC